MIPFEDTSYYLTRDYLGPTAGAVTVALVGLVGFISLLSVALGLARYAWVRAREAKTAEAKAETRKLSPGYTILHGQVETGDALPAVRVRIRQEGREYSSKNGMRHVWSEVDREIEQRPFQLALASGEQVRVLPGDDVFLIDLLAAEPGPRPASVARPQRVRTAQLAAPDFVYACGRLAAPRAGSAYRGGDEGFTLHPWQGKLVLSTEPLEARFARRARFHALWFLAILAVCCFTNGVLFRVYWLELLWGHAVSGNVTQTSTWTTRVKHGVVPHYGVQASIDRGDGSALRVSAETSYVFYTSAKADLALGHAVVAPFVVVPSETAIVDLGTRPTIHDATCVFAWLGLAGLVLAYVVHSRHTRPWYERKKVQHVGAGPLEMPDALA